MMRILDKIDSPVDLKGLSDNKLEKLAGEIRECLVKTISKTGGHLASNLGVVELTIALHSHLNSPQDKIIWDVGHQGYTHKILTGRKNQFSTLRQKNGLSGYLKRSESEHDIIEAGHTSTSISAALGLALARDLQDKDERVYSIIGDGALTGGMAFEALNHAGHLGRDIKVILNDNEMSISSNIGALSHYLSNIRTDPALSRLKEDMEFLINCIPKIGPTVSNTVDRVKNGLKYVFITGVLFEEMGFTYLGPVDGHNIEELRKNFEKADKIEGPVILHVNTEKGKGYKPAAENPRDYHSTGPFRIEDGKSLTQKENLTYSQVFGETLVKLGKKDENIVGITAAMPKGTQMEKFLEEFPDRTYDVGIAEQHAVTLASGLAEGGLKPVFAVYSTFLQRAFDQIVQDLCMQNLPVILGIDRAGIVGKDGETHQGVFDFSYLRMIPNMVVMAPKDENELQHMLASSFVYEKPTAIRYPRGEGYGVKLDDKFRKIPEGKGELLKKGNNVLLIAVGSMVYPTMEAARELDDEGIKTGVINARFVKPLDRELLLRELENYDYAVTVEEQVLAGGFGSAVLELINKNNLDVHLERIGIPDQFVNHGETEEIKAEYGLDKNGIKLTVKNLMASVEVKKNLETKKEKVHSK